MDSDYGPKPRSSDSSGALRQTMIYICGECHSENDIRQQDAIDIELIHYVYLPRWNSMQRMWLQNHVQEKNQASYCL